MAEKGKCQVCSKLSESRCSWCRAVFYCSKEHQKQDWEGHKPSCSKKKYTIEENEKLGRHLVASEDIKADYIILKDKPILLSIKANSLEFTPNKICLGCYKEIKVEDHGGGGGNDDDNDDSASDSSSSEGNSSSASTQSESKICEKCELPICSRQCSSQYFHKAFECRLISEASVAAAAAATTASQSSSPHSTTKPTTTTTGLQIDGESSIRSGEARNGTTKSDISPDTSVGGNETNTSTATKTTTNTDLLGPNYSARETVLRNLIYFRCILLKHVNEKHWNELMSLQSNEESRRDMPNLERTTRVFSIIKKALSQINHPTINQVYKPDVHKILGILDINALHFNISPSEGEVELSALFPTFSLLEHSCAPNIRFYLSPILASGGSGSDTTTTTTPVITEGNIKTSQGGKGSKYLYELYCRSSVKIKKGENLSISYVNLMWNTDKRREFLKKERFFWCECKRCMDPHELGSNFSTFLCPQEGCRALSVPVPKNPENTSGDLHWKCTKCGKVTQSWQVKKVDARLCEMVGRAKASLESYKQLLDKMEELVHPDYYLSFVVNHSIVQMYGEDESTVHDKAMLEEKVALCNRLLHLIKKLDPGLAKLNIYTAVIYYEMQSAILAMAGGEVDDDFKTLRHKPETVKLAKLYLQKCIDCFKYEFLDVPENKLKNLAYKKMEYLDFILRTRKDFA